TQEPFKGCPSCAIAGAVDAKDATNSVNMRMVARTRKTPFGPYRIPAENGFRAACSSRFDWDPDARILLHARLTFKPGNAAGMTLWGRRNHVHSRVQDARTRRVIARWRRRRRADGGRARRADGQESSLVRSHGNPRAHRRRPGRALAGDDQGG